MPNKNYIKGRRKEYKIMQQLRDIGCHHVIRSSGSHSAIDVIGIDLEKRRIFLIQSKPDSMSDNAKNKICAANWELNGSFDLTFEVI